jgi:hypothetical protein
VKALALLSCVLVTGCFYIDPINQRPSIDIRQTSAETVYRKDFVTLEGAYNDPEEQLVFFTWRVYACDDATDFSTCDHEPFTTDVLQTLTFQVPDRRVDVVVPVRSLWVVAEAKDEYGAIARPREELIIAVSDHAPVLSSALAPRYRSVINTAFDLYLKVTDLDDGPDAVTLEWTVFRPTSNPDYTFIDIPVNEPSGAGYVQVGKRLIPQGLGRWEVQVTGTDPLGAVDTETFTFDVYPDDPPCLAQWSPIDAPSGSTLPLTEATLFQVNVVDDILDPYPAIPGDTVLGTTSFSWSIKQPGAGSRTPLGVTSNGVAIDPGNYALGDIVELRVEIADRNNTPITCADHLLTCSVISEATCIQRLTWRMEVR